MLTFVRQLLKDRRHTGAVAPSSRRLAQVMTRGPRFHRGPKRVLEVGPGTGAFTKAILETLRPGDVFHLVEISPLFSRHLEKRLLEPFRRANPGITVELHCGPIESIPLDESFDYIICGLPFNNFPPPLVRRIFRRLMAQLAGHGELNYFEYAGVRAMKGPLLNERGRMDLKRIGATGRILRRRYSGRRRLVVGNFPPAVAVRLVRS